MTVLVDLARPKAQSLRIVFDCLAGSLFLGLMAQLAIGLWFSPVPLSLWSLGILLVGATFGSKKGALIVMAYLAEGAIGLPMFAGLSGGVAALCGPTGGYLFGSILVAFSVGALLEKGWKNASAFFVGSALLLICGTLWLACFFGIKNALAWGLYPFLIGDLIKVGIATSTLQTCRKFAR